MIGILLGHSARVNIYKQIVLLGIWVTCVCIMRMVFNAQQVDRRENVKSISSTRRRIRNMI